MHPFCYSCARGCPQVHQGRITDGRDINEQMTFKVPQMDCAAEEQLVRMKLSDQEGVKRLTFDLPGRTFVVTHTTNGVEIEGLMRELNLGASLVGREQVDELEPDASEEQQRKLLIIVLLING